MVTNLTKGDSMKKLFLMAVLLTAMCFNVQAKELTFNDDGKTFTLDLKEPSHSEIYINSRMRMIVFTVKPVNKVTLDGWRAWQQGQQQVKTGLDFGADIDIMEEKVTFNREFCGFTFSGSYKTRIVCSGYDPSFAPNGMSSSQFADLVGQIDMFQNTSYAGSQPYPSYLWYIRKK